MVTNLKRPYPPGTRVEVNFTKYDERLGWLTGTVVNAPLIYEAVRFDKPNRQFHDLNGACKVNHGWYCSGEEIRVLKTQQIEDDPEYEGLFI